MIRRIRKLVDRSFDAPAGCGFLAPREVEAWLDGQLEPSRREAFDRHSVGGCASCTLLAADLEVFHGVVARGLIESERREFERTESIVRAHLRHKLDALEQEAAATRSGFRLGWRHAAGLATAALLVAVIAVPLMRQGGATPGEIVLPSGSRLHVETMPFSAPPQVRDRQQQLVWWEQAEAAFAAADYDVAATALGRIVESRPDDHDAMLNRGVALIRSGRYAEAVDVLVRARQIAGSQGLLGGIDNYHLGVAAVGAGDLDLARDALRRAVDVGGTYGDRAGLLLPELDRQ